VLEAAGIKTFAQLAETKVDRIKEILEEADPKLLHLADPTTWPRQARLAASGKWEALQKWQDRLKGGRKD
jgi:small subunit ribosomal protein S2